MKVKVSAARANTLRVLLRPTLSSPRISKIKLSRANPKSKVKEQSLISPEFWTTLIKIQIICRTIFLGSRNYKLTQIEMPLLACTTSS